MKKKGIVFVLPVIMTLTMLVLLACPTPAFAEGEVPTAEPSPTTAPALEPAVAETPLTEVLVVEETPVGTPLEGVSLEPTAEEMLPPTEEADTATVADVAIGEVIENLAMEEVVLLDGSGEVIPLASEEAVEVLTSTDPFFWDGTQWVGYTTTGTGCPTNVTCLASPTPFQTAVSAAPAGSMIYVAQGYYDEDVVVNTAMLSFTGFYQISVPVGFAALTPDASGYALVKSITLNADFGTSSGVYAEEVIVNTLNDTTHQPTSTGGRLDDGLKLVNVGGSVEANVNLVDSGKYVIRDFYHSSEPANLLEWACGDPEPYIYPGSNYRMTFKIPLDQMIVDFYEGHGDVRPGVNRDVETRLNDLVEAIKQYRLTTTETERNNDAVFNKWQRIFRYLLGTETATLTSAELAIANGIMNRTQDTPLEDLELYFLWTSYKNAKPETPAYINGQGTQLTFVHRIKLAVSGCIDPSMANYDPNATVDNGQCVPYPTIENPGIDDLGEVVTIANTIVKAPLFMIPVTGMDLVEQAGNLLVNAGLLALGMAVLKSGMQKRKK